MSEVDEASVMYVYYLVALEIQQQQQCFYVYSGSASNMISHIVFKLCCIALSLKFQFFFFFDR